MPVVMQPAVPRPAVAAALAVRKSHGTAAKHDAPPAPPPPTLVPMPRDKSRTVFDREASAVGASMAPRAANYMETADRMTYR